jgi:hypothetical protein
LFKSLRGDNSKRVKMHKKYFKIFFSRTTGPISTRLGINHPGGEGIQVCSNEGRHFALRGDNSKRVKIYKNILKSPEPLGQFQPDLAQITIWERGFKFV